MNLKIPKLYLLLFFVGILPAQDSFNHQPFDSLLQTFVDDQGLVDYQAIKNQHSLLGKYLEILEEVDPVKFESWSKAEKMAFWINAYNAITIEGIVRHYPIEYGNLVFRVRFPKNSIRQIGGFWDKVFIKVMGKEMTLNQIEHEILRGKFKDPRIHAVLVCAANGCPLLENRAYLPETLESRLNQANKNFINNFNKVQLDQDMNILYLSSIFDWYQEDYPDSPEEEDRLVNYPSKSRGVIEFIMKYLSQDQQNYILNNTPQIKYLDYDWTLNEQP